MLKHFPELLNMMEQKRVKEKNNDSENKNCVKALDEKKIGKIFCKSC